MAKNISIKEGNLSRNFTPKKLKTPLQGGGDCLWVPKDECNLKTKHINRTGVYQAWVDGAYGYSKVTVTGIEDDVSLMEKSVAENGTYEANADGFYGYIKAIVNVSGGGTYTDPDTGLSVTPAPSTDPGSSVTGNNPDTGNTEIVQIDSNGALQITVVT